MRRGVVPVTLRRRLRAAAGAILVLAACTGPAAPSGPSSPTNPLPGPRAERRDEVRPNNWFRASCGLPIEWLERIERGDFPGRGPEISFVPYNENPFGGFPLATTHSGPWPFLQEIPLLFYGPGFVRRQGAVPAAREVTIADVAPTLARLLEVRLPRGTEGRPIEGVLLPREQRSEDLRLVVVVVWDGGGMNVLDRWRGRWPFLESLVARGTLVEGATVGSSPSVTPAVHASLGTGSFPHRHGIVNILQRDGDRMVPGVGLTPERLEVPSLADVYDRATGNEAKVGIVAKDSLHFPMAGHGAGFPGADRDVGVLYGKEAGDSLVGTMAPFFENPFPFEDLLSRMHREARKLDREDGKLNGSWLGHELPDDPVEERGFNKVPVWIPLQTYISKAVMAEGGFGGDSVPDLFFTNYKDPDYVGHAFNFHSEEEGRTIEYADAALRDLARFVDRTVGRGRWVLVMTADHGQSPLPESAGTWPIDGRRLRADIGAFVGANPEEVVQHVKQNGAWIDTDILRERNKSLVDVARFLMRYRIEDNARGLDYPAQYRDRLAEPLFEAAFPSARIGRIMECARG